MPGTIQTPGFSSPLSSTTSQDPPSHLASLLASMTLHSIASLASRVRYKENRPQEGKQDYGSLIKPPKHGSFNLLYPVEFADGVKWLLRIPSTGENGRFTTNSSRSLRSEVYTMKFLRHNTSIPIPKSMALMKQPTTKSVYRTF